MFLLSSFLMRNKKKGKWLSPLLFFWRLDYLKPLWWVCKCRRFEIEVQKVYLSSLWLIEGVLELMLQCITPVLHLTEQFKWLMSVQFQNWYTSKDDQINIHRIFGIHMCVKRSNTQALYNNWNSKPLPTYIRIYHINPSG